MIRTSAIIKFRHGGELLQQNNGKFTKVPYAAAGLML